MVLQHGLLENIVRDHLVHCEWFWERTCRAREQGCLEIVGMQTVVEAMIQMVHMLRIPAAARCAGHGRRPAVVDELSQTQLEIQLASVHEAAQDKVAVAVQTRVCWRHGDVQAVEARR